MKKESILNLTLMVIIGVLVVVSTVKAATTISTNIVTEGTLSVTSSSTLLGNVVIGTTTTSSNTPLKVNSTYGGYLEVLRRSGGYDHFNVRTVDGGGDYDTIDLEMDPELGFNIYYGASSFAFNSWLQANMSNGGIFEVKPSAAKFIGMNVGVGVVPSVNSILKVATSTNNATTSVEIGKASQNKGSCLVMYDATGAVKYVSVIGTSLVVSATSCQ